MHNELNEIRVIFCDEADQTLPLPRYETVGAAGADICANLSQETREKGITLDPMARALIPTGLKIAIPQGYELQLRPRSGLALKHGLTLLNTPGTIDSDYRGHVQILMVNFGQNPFLVEHGMRIAQAVMAPVIQANWRHVSQLDETDRGAGGFGSTGTKRK